MEIKRPNWSKCNGLATIRNNETNEPPDLNSKLEKGAHVLAKYENCDVYMEVTEVQQNGNFLATIKFFEPANVAPPKDLSQGDCVQIDREHICCIFYNLKNRDQTNLHPTDR